MPNFRCRTVGRAAIAALFLSTLACGSTATEARSHPRAPRTFRVWVFSDAHVGTDQEAGRESLADALRQSETATGFDWDIALDLGDMSGAQKPPKDAEGTEIVRQFGVLRKHRREQVYDLSGNHDRSGLDEPQARWWRKWLDPTGEHTESSHVVAAKRPFPIDGTWERYSFRVGNLVFAMMSDINEPTQKIGRGTLGGNPGGVISGETLRWWKQLVDNNRASIIISAHHYVLKNTTTASDEWEGVQRDEHGDWQARYHGYYAEGTPQGASFLYWVDSKADSGAVENFLSASPGRVDLWLGGHTHTSPEDTFGNKSHVEQRWGTTFINVAGLTRYHGRFPNNNIPRSWLLTFTEGSDEITARCYLHGNEYAQQGWFPKLDHVIKLSKAFELAANTR
jgi:predicted MPP superfamily phosphohydrolase